MSRAEGWTRDQIRGDGDGRAERHAQRSRSPLPWLAAAAFLCIASLAARWPGVAMYDSVSQYGQGIDGDYTDWHPPIMARLWSLLRLGWPGTQPMLLLQMLAWWGGLGLIAAALGRRQRHGAAALVLLVGVAPLGLGWATAILKDAQMAAALLLATGLVAWWRLDDRAVPRWAAALAGVLIAYATLVRGNALFATVPFSFALAHVAGARPLWQRAVLALVAMVAVIGLSPLINHRLFGAEPTQVERALPLYDMAGTAHEAGLATLPGLSAAQWREAERRGCYSPYFWNPFGEPAQCDFVGQAVAFGDDQRPHLMRDWAAILLAHPFAYAAHRAGHLNSNLRFWVGPGEGDAAPPLVSERNDLGLGAPPGPAAAALVDGGKLMALSPLGWPFLWLAVALGLLWAGMRTTSAQGRLAFALALTAACMSASFAVVSIASDLRYHLWSMVAAALALILMVDARALDIRRARIAGAVVVALGVIAALGHLGLAARIYVPVPPHIPPAAHP
ncbi:hypothetical protein [Sphingomonas nostoxanthinifaciens]|uniref:hypothetical protein n=1 Tax=Sphingomonas nostoxanthinifaciens TaxID=2872652 RepID=UPI001CC20536|nr:hypothetical protein [Sphingomonas nostoxanthinifaciens]UAK24455.1 hypothetical protein K8P63_19450 [Sphingomonas nostoxanthinifaciens]